MAERVCCSADRSSLLGNRDVPDQTPSSASQGYQQHPPNQDLPGGRVSCKLTVAQDELETCSCGSGNASSQTRQTGAWNGRQPTGLTIFVMFSCVTLLLSVCSLLYAWQLSKSNTWEMEVLRLKMQRLDELCGITTQWSASQAHVFTDSAATNDNSAASGPRRFPWQQNANRPVFRAQEESYDQTGANAYNNDDEEEGGSPYHSFHGRSRPKRSSRGRRARNGNGKPKICKKLDRCIKAKEKGKEPKGKCKRMLACLPPPVEKQTGLKAVHFTSQYGDESRKKKFAENSYSEGLLMTGEEAPLLFSVEADWMGEVYKDRSQLPIKSLRDGGFSILQSGLYFVYSSVMFHDIKPRQAQAVVVNGTKRLKCMDSVDFVEKNATAGQHKYKTCAISGVIYLNAGERMEVQNLYPETQIDQAKDATYVGAVLLYPFQIDRKP